MLINPHYPWYNPVNILFQKSCLELTYVEVWHYFTDGNLILQTNTAVIKLNLADNWISAEGAGYIAEMLRENCYISDLVMVHSNLIL